MNLDRYTIAGMLLAYCLAGATGALASLYHFNPWPSVVLISIAIGLLIVYVRAHHEDD